VDVADAEAVALEQGVERAEDFVGDVLQNEQLGHGGGASLSSRIRARQAIAPGAPGRCISSFPSARRVRYTHAMRRFPRHSKVSGFTRREVLRAGFASLGLFSVGGTLTGCGNESGG